MPEAEKFDIAIIGGGPGGYVAAIKAAQSKKRVCLIEKENLGGTCLNVGCIPTKSLIAHAKVVETIKRSGDFGVSVKDFSFDYAKMKEKKDSVVKTLRQGVVGLLQANKVTVFNGHAKFVSPKEIKVKGEKNTLIHAEKTVIATGSKPFDIPAFPCDHKKILDSTSILEMTELPKTLAIIGGGYIGCEFASLYAELGVNVIILEALESILFLQGKEIASALTSSFKKKGVDVRCNLFVEGIDTSGPGVKIKIKDSEPVEADLALVSVGRRIVSDGVGLEHAGVRTTDKGEIVVNEKMETNIPGIYAIGDVTGKFLLAHVASHQGIVAAVNATGGEATMHYNAVPAVIFTHPEIAMVGMTVEEATAAGYDASVGKFPFKALGKAVASLEAEGFAQVVADRKTGQILGAQVMGAEATNLIAEMALAIANELTLESVADTIHAHPTLPEVWLEASLLAGDMPIHFPPRIKR